MSKNNKNNTANNSFKIVIIILTTCLLGSFMYIYKVSDRTKDIIISLREEKSNLLKDLEKSNLYLTQAIKSKNSFSSKLVAEQAKIQQLILELKNKDVSEKTITVYKKDAEGIDNRIMALLNEINGYKKKIDSTNIVLNKTNVDLNKSKEKNDTLSVANKNLSKKITDASKLYYYNLQTNLLKAKGSGKFTATDRANKVDLIKVSFAIAENDLVKSSEKEFYIQIIDMKNNVIGSKETQKFGDDILTYSTNIKSKYQNKTIKLEGEIPVTNLIKGNYFINVFDKNKLILKDSFILQ